MNETIADSSRYLRLILVAALFYLNQLAHSRAGMNHHAKYKKMAFIKDYLQDKTIILWALGIVLILLILARIKRTPLWYRCLGWLLCSFTCFLLIHPKARELVIYYYAFMVSYLMLMLHGAVGIIASRPIKEKTKPL